MKNDDLQEYIHTYKSDLLKDKDKEKGVIFERANEIDTKLASQLLLITSVLLTIIGSFVTTGNQEINDKAKVILISTIIFLLISIGTGLLDFYFNSKFFVKWGDHLHKQGRLILDDKSLTYEDLESLRDKLQQTSDDMPIKAPTLFRILQVASFLVGIIFILILIISAIYSA